MADSIAKELVRWLLTEEPKDEEEAPKKVVLPKLPRLPRKVLKPRQEILEPIEEEVPEKRERARRSRVRKMMIAHEIFSLPVSLREPSS